MARVDLLKKLFHSYQTRDDQAFRAIAEEIIASERKKHHPIVANELERILDNGLSNRSKHGALSTFSPLPQDTDRRTFLLEIRQPNRYLDDLILNKVIRELIDRLLLEFREWEVLESNGLLPVRRVLFCGPSGCGKTAMAEALSAELGLPLLYVRFDAVVSSLLGQTAANLRKVFDYAQQGQWVMFFDEFDAIGRSRDDFTEHGEIKRVVNSFLQIMDNFNGRSLIIAATNFEQALDPAIWRRFDDVLRFEKPDDDHIQMLVKKLTATLPFHNRHLKNLLKSLSGTTYADVERVCLDIRKSYILRGQHEIREEDIVQALERHSYRLSILKKAYENTAPTVDKE